MVQISTPTTVDLTTHAALTGTAHEASSTFVSDSVSTNAATVDFTAGRLHVITLDAACTFTFTPPAVPTGSPCILKIIQDGTGGRIATWPTVEWYLSSEPVLSTAIGAVDILQLLWDGTVWYGTLMRSFA